MVFGSVLALPTHSPCCCASAPAPAAAASTLMAMYLRSIPPWNQLTQNSWQLTIHLTLNLQRIHEGN